MVMSPQCLVFISLLSSNLNMDSATYIKLEELLYLWLLAIKSNEEDIIIAADRFFLIFYVTNH